MKNRSYYEAGFRERTGKGKGRNMYIYGMQLILSYLFQWLLYSLEGCIDRFYQTVGIPIASPFLFARISLPLKIPQIQTIPASNRILPSPTHSLRPNLHLTQPSKAFTLIAPSKMALMLAFIRRYWLGRWVRLQFRRSSRVGGL